MHKSAYMNMKKYADIFSALSDTTRLRIMRVIIKAGVELCVCEIVDSLQKSQYSVSRHLKELKVAGFVNERKTGRWVFYSIAKTKDEFQKLILHSIASIPEDLFLMDTERLKLRLCLREGGKCVIGLKSPERKKVVAQLRVKMRKKRP